MAAPKSPCVGTPRKCNVGTLAVGYDGAGTMLVLCLVVTLRAIDTVRVVELGAGSLGKSIPATTWITWLALLLLPRRARDSFKLAIFTRIAQLT